MREMKTDSSCVSSSLTCNFSLLEHPSCLKPAVTVCPSLAYSHRMTSKWDSRDHRVVCPCGENVVAGLYVRGRGPDLSYCHALTVSWALQGCCPMSRLMDGLVDPARLKKEENWSSTNNVRSSGSTIGQKRPLIRSRVGYSVPGDSRVGCLGASPTFGVAEPDQSS